MHPCHRVQDLQTTVLAYHKAFQDTVRSAQSLFRCSISLCHIHPRTCLRHSLYIPRNPFFLSIHIRRNMYRSMPSLIYPQDLVPFRFNILTICFCTAFTLSKKFSVAFLMFLLYHNIFILDTPAGVFTAIPPGRRPGRFRSPCPCRSSGTRPGARQSGRSFPHRPGPCSGRTGRRSSRR